MNLQMLKNGYGFTFGGSHSSDHKIIAEKTLHPLTPPLNAITQAIPNRPGGWYFRTDLGMREIEINVAIVSDVSTFRPDIKAIAQWLDPQKGVQPLIFDNDPSTVYNAILYNDGGQANFITQLVNIGRATLYFLCPDPFGYAASATSISVASGTASKVITNADYEAFPTLTVTFSAATSSFKVTKQETGEFINVIYNFVANDQLVIDCNNGLITINGNAQMPTLDINSDFFSLSNGTNTLVFASPSAAATVVSYKPRYL